MSSIENFRLASGVLLLFVILSSILYACGTQIQTNSERFKVMQDSGEEDTFERRLFDIQMADAESEYDELVDEMKRVNGKHKLELSEHGSDVLVSRNIERIHEREVSNIVSSVTESTTTVEQVTVYEVNQTAQQPSDSNSLNYQIDYTCYITNHCRDYPYLAKPCSVIVSRAAWGARDTRSASYMNETVSIIFIHHTAMERCFSSQECILEMKKIQDLHMDTNGWDDIGYSFVVGDDGMAYEARGWKRVGAHTRGWNSISVAIAVMGNFNEVIPSDAALKAIDSLISCGILSSNLLANYTLYGHRTVSRTFDSPGHMFNDIIYKLGHNMQTLLPERRTI